MSPTMLAVRYDSIGEPLALKLEEVQVPVPARGEVLVRIHAASVNPVDWKIATGSFRPLVRGGVPRTMGSDFAGEVAGLGAGVSGYAIGERVFGFVDPFKRREGTYAQFCAVPATHVCAVPDSLTLIDAAALACAGATAVTLCTLGRVADGSRVLVNGAAGGVGHATVQVAVARGAVVTAVASAARHEFVRSLGAAHCIDYRAQPMSDWPDGYDAVLDCVPNIARQTQRRLLRSNGVYVTTVPGAPTLLLDPLLNRLGGIQRHGVMLQPQETIMRELIEHIEQRKLRAEIEREYSLAEAPQAIEHSRSGQVRGKVVLRVP
jgi:NADPH:quinone reductase-like Zn-dependent oxidoreductase